MSISCLRKSEAAEKRLWKTNHRKRRNVGNLPVSGDVEQERTGRKEREESKKKARKKSRQTLARRKRAPASCGQMASSMSSVRSRRRCTLRICGRPAGSFSCCKQGQDVRICDCGIRHHRVLQQVAWLARSGTVRSRGAEKRSDTQSTNG